jgi:nucleoside-triphosphatase THEP1
MECLSDTFKNLLKKILDSEKLVTATIPLKSGGFIEKIKKRPDVKLFELKESNRNDLPPEILREVKESDRRND